MRVLSKSLLPSLLAVFSARSVSSITCPVPTTPNASAFAGIPFDYIIIGQSSPVGQPQILADMPFCRWWYSWRRVVGQVDQYDYSMYRCLCPTFY